MGRHLVALSGPSVGWAGDNSAAETQQWRRRWCCCCCDGEAKGKGTRKKGNRKDGDGDGERRWLDLDLRGEFGEGSWREGTERWEDDGGSDGQDSGLRR